MIWPSGSDIFQKYIAGSFVDLLVPKRQPTGTGHIWYGPEAAKAIRERRDEVRRLAMCPRRAPKIFQVRLSLEIDLPSTTTLDAFVAQLQAAEAAVTKACPTWRARFNLNRRLGELLAPRMP